jgi:exopolysaccharide biosynthesis polyprenyl glycosylphosphotransferase
MIEWVTNPEKLKQYLLLVGDTVIVLLAFTLGIFADALRVGEELITVAQQIGVEKLILVLFLQLVSFFVFDLYDLQAGFTRLRGFLTVTCAVVATFVMSSVLFFFAGWFAFDWTVLLTYAPGMMVGTWLWRSFFFNSLVLVKHKHKLALVGLDGFSESLLRDLEGLPVRGYDFVGVLYEDTAGAKHPRQSSPVYPCTSEILPQLVEEKGIDTLVYSLKTRLSDTFLQAVLNLRLSGLEVYDVPTFYSKLTGKVPINCIDARWVLQTVGNCSNSALTSNARRIVEAIGAAVMLVITAPLWAIIGVAIKVNSRGAVFLKQERLGLNQRPFTLYKFRTMLEDAEAQTGPTWTHAHDPRITRVGHLLRKTGLDELPQLINIIRGEMAFVGSRPIRKYFADILAKEIPFYHVRFSIRPGITGWSQVRYDYAGSKEGQFEKFQYELFYLQNTSLLLDMFIIMKTLQKALLHRISDVGR